MLFNRWSFAVFLPLVFAQHHAGRRAGWQVGVLTVASFAFYGWGTDAGGSPHWKLLPLLVLSTLVNGFAAQELLSSGRSDFRRRVVLGVLSRTRCRVHRQHRSQRGHRRVGGW